MDEQNQSTSTGRGKRIAMFAALALALIGASVGGTFYFLGGADPAVAGADGDGATPEPEQRPPALYHTLHPPFVVNYLAGATSRMLQAELAVMARDPVVLEVLVDHAPLVRSRIVAYLTDLDFQALQTLEGKQALREGVKGLLDELLREQLDGVAEEAAAGKSVGADDSAGAVVEAVLLNSFVMQ